MDCSKQQRIYWKYKQDFQNEDTLRFQSFLTLSLLSKATTQIGIDVQQVLYSANTWNRILTYEIENTLV